MRRRPGWRGASPAARAGRRRRAPGDNGSSGSRAGGVSASRVVEGLTGGPSHHMVGPPCRMATQPQGPAAQTCPPPADARTSRRAGPATAARPPGCEKSAPRRSSSSLSTRTAAGGRGREGWQVRTWWVRMQVAWGVAWAHSLSRPAHPSTLQPHSSAAVAVAPTGEAGVLCGQLQTLTRDGRSVALQHCAHGGLCRLHCHARQAGGGLQLNRLRQALGGLAGCGAGGEGCSGACAR